MPTPAYADGTKATVIFTFDDGWTDQYTNAYPILNEKGFKATIYVNSSTVQNNADNFMTLSQLQGLYASGWDISNHTTNHNSSLGYLTDAASMEQLKQIYLNCQNCL